MDTKASWKSLGAVVQCSLPCAVERCELLVALCCEMVQNI